MGTRIDQLQTGNMSRSSKRKLDKSGKCLSIKKVKLTEVEEQVNIKRSILLGGASEKAYVRIRNNHFKTQVDRYCAKTLAPLISPCQRSNQRRSLESKPGSGINGSISGDAKNDQKEADASPKGKKEKFEKCNKCSQKFE